MCRVYIADTDPSFIARSRQALKRSRGIEIAGTTDSGRVALRELVRLRPDVLLTDIQLPELDGIALLREARRLNSPPSVIICTRFYSGASMEWSFKYGASYFLCKPIDFDRLSELVVEAARCERRDQETPGVEGGTKGPSPSDVRLLLNELGISSRHNGGVYLMESVRSLQENELLLKNMTHGLYAELAGRLNTTPPRVERCLRSAIAVGYERGAMKYIFPRRPTNREFIEYLLNQLSAAGGGQRHIQNM